METLTTTVWRLLEKPNRELPYDPATRLLCTHPRAANTRQYKHAHTDSVRHHRLQQPTGRSHPNSLDPMSE